MRAPIIALLLSSCVPDPPDRSRRLDNPNPDPAPVDPGDDPIDDPVDPPPPDQPPPDQPPPDQPPPDPNALTFSRDIRPIFEAHCTECHDEGRAYNFTSLPLSPAGAGVTVDLILAAATSVMPPAPRERMPAPDLDKIRTWKAQGLYP